jgi:hypothetical protein
MKLTTIILLTGLTLTAQADDKQTRADACTELQKTVKLIMKHRQEGTPMATLYTAVSDDFFKSVVIDAFEYPKMSVQENQQDVTNDFADKYFLMCVKAG